MMGEGNGKENNSISLIFTSVIRSYFVRQIGKMLWEKYVT
jgi:hypothetical protein